MALATDDTQLVAPPPTLNPQQLAALRPQPLPSVSPELSAPLQLAPQPAPSVPQVTGVGALPTGIAADPQQQQAAPQASGGDLYSDILRLEGSGPNSISPKGAIGRSQIMPSTAAMYGVSREQLFDPVVNEQLGRRIVADLSRRYNGDPTLVKIAYNAGPGAADRFIASGKNPAVLPQETQNYIGAAGMSSGSAVLDSIRQHGQQAAQESFAAAGRQNDAAREAFKNVGDYKAGIGPARARIDAALQKSDEAIQNVQGMLQKQPKPPEIDGIQKLGGLATIIGIMAGSLTRRPLIASFNAAGAAISAYNDGDRERYKLAYDSWKTQMDGVEQIANMNRDRLHDIIADEKMTEEQKLAAADLFMRAAGMQAKADELRNGGWHDLIKLDEDMLRIQEQFRKEREQTQQRLEDRDAAHPWYGPYKAAREAAGPNITPEADAKLRKQFQEMFPSGVSQRPTPMVDKDGTPYLLHPDGTATTVGPKEEQKPYTPQAFIKPSGSGAQGQAEQLSDDSIKSMAERVLAGDHSAVVGLGYGTVGANNRTRVNNMIAKLAAERGMSGQDIAAAQLGFAGRRAELQTIGRYQARIEQSATEAATLMPQVLQTSEAVPRTELTDLNKAIMAGRVHTGDPKAVQFSIAVNSFVQAYGRALNPTGAPHVADIEHARELLSTSMSKGQIKGAMRQLAVEIQAARAATDEVWDSIITRTAGKQPTGPALMERLGISTPSPEMYPTPTPDAIKALQEGHGTAEQFNAIFGPGAAAKIQGK